MNLWFVPSYATVQLLWIKKKIDATSVREYVDNNHNGFSHRCIDYKRDTAGQGVYFICVNLDAMQMKWHRSKVLKYASSPDATFYEFYLKFPGHLIEPRRRVEMYTGKKRDWALSTIHRTSGERTSS